MVSSGLSWSPADFALALRFFGNLCFSRKDSLWILCLCHPPTSGLHPPVCSLWLAALATGGEEFLSFRRAPSAARLSFSISAVSLQGASENQQRSGIVTFGFAGRVHPDIGTLR